MNKKSRAGKVFSDELKPFLLALAATIIVFIVMAAC